MATPKRAPAQKKPYMNLPGFQLTPRVPQKKATQLKPVSQQKDVASDRYKFGQDKELAPRQARNSQNPRNRDGLKRRWPLPKWQTPKRKNPNYQAQKQTAPRSKTFSVHTEPPESSAAKAPAEQVTISITKQTEPVKQAPREEGKNNSSSAGPLPSNEARAIAQQNNEVINQVIYANTAYTDQAGRSFIQVSLLEEIWEIDWVQPLSLNWNQEWEELRSDLKIHIQDTREEQNNKILWIKGELEVIALGTVVDTKRVMHETVRLPFTATILPPSFLQSKGELQAAPGPTFPLPNARWAETGDWRAVLLSDPFQQPASHTGMRGYNGVASISGRIWWFRKQFLPLPMGGSK